MTEINELKYKVDVMLKYFSVKEMYNYFKEEYEYIMQEEVIKKEQGIKSSQEELEIIEKLKEQYIDSARQLELVLGEMRDLLGYGK